MNQNTQSLLMLVKIQFPLNSFLLFSPTNLDVWLAELCPWTSQAAQWSSSAEFSHFRRLIDWHFSSFHFECDTHFGNHELSKPVWFLCHSSTISLYSWIFLVCESSGTLVTSALCATWSILHCNSVLWLCALQLVTEQSARYFPSPHSIHLSSVFHHPLANTSLIWKMTAICLTAQLRPLHFSPDSSSCFWIREPSPATLTPSFSPSWWTWASLTVPWRPSLRWVNPTNFQIDVSQVVSSLTECPW